MTPLSSTAPDRRLTDLLAATALGVYLLVVAGATTGLLDGGGACATWPACEGRWLRSFDPALLAAWGHRLVALLVAGLLLATAWRARREGVDRRVRLALGVAVVLYPGQVALGALTALRGATRPLAAAHLTVAMAIFTGVLLALAWRLETETADDGSPAGVGSLAPGDPVADTPVDTDDRTRPAATLRERVGGYVRLTKPKLWWLLCLVAVAAMALAAGPTLSLGTVVTTLTGGVLAIGASGTFNNVLERDVDRRMDRTADRPLVEGVIPLWRAVGFGVGLAVASVAVFLVFVNALAAALGLLAILFYSVVYTLLLKPNTDQNVVVGGAVGAFPALIGWAAVEGRVGVPAVVLGAVVFLWTPAHFYNLALAYREDYARAGVPMFPVVRGTSAARRHVLLYAGATMGCAALLGAATRLGVGYGVTLVAAGGLLLWAVLRLHRERTDAAAMRTFHAANAYLGSLLLVVTVEGLLA